MELSKTTQKALKIIRTRRNVTPSEIAQRFGKKTQWGEHRVKMLLEMGLVEVHGNIVTIKE